MAYKAPVRDLTFVLNEVLEIDRYSNQPGFADVSSDLVGQILDTARRLDAKLGGNGAGLGAADAVDVSQRDFDALVGRDVDTRDTCHGMFFSCSTGRMATAPSQRFDKVPKTGHPK